MRWGDGSGLKARARQDETLGEVLNDVSMQRSWCSVGCSADISEGLQLAWRPRNYKLPFTKVRKGIPQDAPPEVRDAYMEKNRDMQRRTKSKLMTRMAELEGTPVDPRELNRRSVMIVDAAEEETQVEEDIDFTDQFAEAEQPMLAMEPMEGQ
ncbi:unnamed protein product [Symbiodinium necroappetens]|uniref:Uncharacterized protein n=2 Tax=Symbiodinium TaxID=2949 RepID=A0A812VE16_9DINO|nr:hypothetical protein AK812_SmicGene40689 [Symbiodinium microadriaticum]CAE7188742.1 unnamed protein product [Symbiodinium sp. KB8]CAE7617262.1 unnamed protein product [Symbiodinium necroappetens]